MRIAIYSRKSRFTGKGESVENQVQLCKEYSNCGSFLRPRVNSNKRRDRNGHQTFAYLCELKKKSKGECCNIPNINGNTLDKLVCSEILKYNVEGSHVYEKLKTLKNNISAGRSTSQIALDAVRAQIANHKSQIDQLIMLLAISNEDELLYRHISNSVEKLDEQIKLLQTEEIRLSEEVSIKGDYRQQLEIVFDSLSCFANAFNTSSVHERRSFLRSIIEKIIWDGKEIHIFLFGESQE
jgi:site-specific DNA recombinase